MLLATEELDPRGLLGRADEGDDYYRCRFDFDQWSQLCFSAALHRRLSCETTLADSIQDVATFATCTYDDVLRRIPPVRFKTDSLVFRVLFSFIVFFRSDQHRNSVIAILPNKEFVSHRRYLFL